MGMNEGDTTGQRNNIGAGQEIVSHASGGLTVTAFGLSDIGCQRSINQDTLGNRVSLFTAAAQERGLLYAVADGMGGHANGEVASAQAIDELFQRYYQVAPTTTPQEALTTVMQAANLVVYETGKAAGAGSMGTTLTVVLLRGAVLYVGNIGDSRTYLIRGEKIRQLSQDHSLIGEQIRSGVLTEQQARASSMRNVITRAVGYRDTVEPETFAFQVQAGDMMLLCSDGLHGLVENEEMAQALSKQSLGEAVTGLIALARERGGPDNITALAVRLDHLGTATTTASDEQMTVPLPVIDNAATQPLPRIEPERTEEFILASTPAATPAPDTEPPPHHAAAPPPTLPPPPPVAPPAPERTRSATPPPPPRQAGTPTWLFLLIPLLLIVLIAGGIFLYLNRNQVQPTTPLQPTASSVPVTTPTVISTTALSPTLGANQPVTPAQTPTPRLSEEQGGQRTPVGATGQPVLPRTTTPAAPGAIIPGSGQTRQRVNGVIRFAEAIPIPDNLTNDWQLVAMSDADWQRQKELAPPKGESRLGGLPTRTEFSFALDLDVSQDDLFVLILRRNDHARFGTIEPGVIRLERSGRLNTGLLTLRVINISDHPDPDPLTSHQAVLHEARLTRYVIGRC